MTTEYMTAAQRENIAGPAQDGSLTELEAEHYLRWSLESHAALDEVARKLRESGRCHVFSDPTVSCLTYSEDRGRCDWCKAAAEYDGLVSSADQSDTSDGIRCDALIGGDDA